MPTMQADAGTGLVSPFGGLHAAGETTGAAMGPVRAVTELQSPFAAGLVAEPGETADGPAGELLEQLADEEFADALEALVDEAAAQHLADQESFTARPSLAESRHALRGWIEPLAGAADRIIDTLAGRLATVDPLSVSPHELTELIGPAAPEQLGVEGFDNFLGGLWHKATSLVHGAVNLAKKGLAAAANVLPLLGKLKGLARSLLDKVLRSALNILPESVRPIAQMLAAKLGITQSEQPAGDPVTRLAENFDLELAGLLYGGQEAEESESEGPIGDLGAHEGAIGELDMARERLAAQLTELPAGTAPVAELEQFLPIAMGVGPLVKTVISVIGRERVMTFIANRIADLIKGMVGADAAGKISRPLVDAGFRVLGFELPAGQEHTLAGEALASTVEGTALRLLELPAEAFADELQLDAAIQRSFAEAAAAAMPDRLLHPDLPEREAAGEGVAWVLMPRGIRPHYRHRRCTKVFVVPVSRQLARAVPWSNGGTLETYLLDRGAERWPVQTEVELYEAVPGTHLGHLPGGPGEVQALTPEVAGLLLREPGLGRRLPPLPPGRLQVRPAAGRRFYRIRPTGLPGHHQHPHHRQRRLLVAIDLNSSPPRLRVSLRLSERAGQQLLAQLDGPARDTPGALTALQQHYASALPAELAAQLVRRSLAADATAAQAAAGRVTAGVTSALSAFLAQRAAQLVAAIRDPAEGVTITVTFPGLTKEALAGTLPDGQVTVTPGWPHHGGHHHSDLHHGGQHHDGQHHGGQHHG